MTQTDSDKQTESNDELDVLLFETSPYGNVDAILQHDHRSVYFYLNPRDQQSGFTPKACWVRNLEPGPYVINQDDFLAGRQVALPRTYTRSNQPGRLPAVDELQVVWFEEGNGAALLEGSNTTKGESAKILAVIPPWSSQEGFHGYAAECAVDSPICWPLPKNPRLKERVDQAIDFWSSFSRKPDPFIGLRESLLNAYPALFTDGQHPILAEQYYDIGGATFPPRGLIEFCLADRIVLLSVAMSLCPQPNVELATPEPSLLRRIELGIELPIDIEAATLEQARTELARLASYPWRTFRWLGAGHTCQFAGVFPEGDKAQLINFQTFLAQKNRRPTKTEPIEFALPTFRQDPINLLWLVPQA